MLDLCPFCAQKSEGNRVRSRGPCSLNLKFLLGKAEDNLLESGKDRVPFTKFYDSLILGTRGTVIAETSATRALTALTNKWGRQILKLSLLNALKVRITTKEVCKRRTYCGLG